MILKLSIPPFIMTNSFLVVYFCFGKTILAWHMQSFEVPFEYTALGFSGIESLYQLLRNQLLF